MDLQGISWVGDMYNKFESMCVEVEETMYQDTVKYVESQIKTVGASVKKFYSDVVQDLLPPSLDPVKEENRSITAVDHINVSVSEKTEVENQGGSVNSKAEQLAKDSDIVAKDDNNVNNGTCSTVSSVNKSYELSLHGLVVQYDASKDHESQSAQKDLSNPQTYAENGSDNGQDFKDKSAYSISSLNANVTKDSGEELTSGEILSEIDEHLWAPRGVSSKLTSVLEENRSREDGAGSSGMEGNKNVNAIEESKATISSSENMSKISDETSNPSAASKFKNGDADNRGLLVSEQFDKMKLGESCVLVEKSEHSFKVPLTDEQKSYKKKIRDVFSPRRWSKGKLDKEQFAAWYEEQSGRKLLPASLKHPGILDSRQLESLELEWELL